LAITFIFTNNSNILCNVFNAQSCFCAGGPSVSLAILGTWIEYLAAHMRIMHLIIPVMIVCYLSRI